ncbi:hypothetical protein ACHHYP_13180 [Achlya hypogyna]|uniref:RING-type domain-containing protein n=1 Tax=Achlya hypogyna TaxID=1202772 RepID=A0A1V9YFS2_ACHHY|nr:hypothetical protein ACHHYP_13180 [Achlya hypogyna]
MVLKRSKFFPLVAAPPNDSGSSCGRLYDTVGAYRAAIAICLQAILAGASIACIHRFCLPCIRAWAEVSSTCPLCKTGFEAIVDDATRAEIHVAPKTQAVPDDATDFALDEDHLADGSEIEGYELDDFVVPDDFIEFACESSDSEEELAPRRRRRPNRRPLALYQFEAEPRERRKRLRRAVTHSVASVDEEDMDSCIPAFEASAPSTPLARPRVSKYFKAKPPEANA